MNIFDAIWLGIIEGVTEFIPVSSTGHLIVLSEFLGIEQNNVNKAFEIIIQFAAIMALVFIYPSKFTFKHINLWKEKHINLNLDNLDANKKQFVKFNFSIFWRRDKFFELSHKLHFLFRNMFFLI